MGCFTHEHLLGSHPVLRWNFDKATILRAMAVGMLPMRITRVDKFIDMNRSVLCGRGMHDPLLGLHQNPMGLSPVNCWFMMTGTPRRFHENLVHDRLVDSRTDNLFVTARLGAATRDPF